MCGPDAELAGWARPEGERNRLGEIESNFAVRLQEDSWSDCVFSRLREFLP